MKKELGREGGVLGRGACQQKKGRRAVHCERVTVSRPRWTKKARPLEIADKEVETDFADKATQECRADLGKQVSSHGTCANFPKFRFFCGENVNL